MNGIKMIYNIWDNIKNILNLKGVIQIFLIVINGSIVIIWLWLIFITPNYKVAYMDWIVLILNMTAVIVNYIVFYRLRLRN